TRRTSVLMVCEYYTETAQLTEGAARLSFLNSQRIVYLLQEADRIDAGKLTTEDVLNPQGYVLVSMTTDGKRAEDEPYWLRVIRLLRDATLEEVMKAAEVARRCQDRKSVV